MQISPTSVNSVTPAFPAYDFRSDYSRLNLQRFLKHCADHEASDILIQGGDKIWVEVHGRQLEGSVARIQQGQMSPLMAALWGAEVEANVRAGRGADRPLELAGEDIGLARGQMLRFRCNFVQGRVAQIDEAFIASLRVIGTGVPDIHKMNLEPELFEALYPAMGLVLVCGPTGSGKTTLQTAVYAHSGMTMPDRKVITFEDPIEFVLGGEHWRGPQPAQSEIGRDIESFAAGLRNAMRRKPAAIGIGEIRDIATIDAAIEASLTGHATYATGHVDSCAEAINRFIQMYPSAQQSAAANRLMGALRVILVQRLLKTVDGRRVAIREYVIFDRELRNQLQAEHYEQWSPMIRQRLESARQTLDDKAWALYEQGRIEASEFVELAGKQEFKYRMEHQHGSVLPVA
ncbi:plasmid transfer ATPase TraJ [Achromobacter insuavis]|uniref:plasmid transfer ATPase TraJ n=1 Tax=Achromobacter insuavis TaxID=1287735 RepID=UPI001F12BCA0|nr:plasmid transfer ATPase TraJ [Achromobacter insuavis]